jgi:hypothetical protein
MRKTTKMYNEELLVEEAEWDHDKMSCRLQPEPFIQKASISENITESRNDWMSDAQRKEFEAKFSK